jgi:ABC-type multidrug transport system permease subunit
MKIPKIIFKNLKIILRSPSTIVLLILAPMILMFLIGLSYNNNGKLTDTSVGIYGDGIEFFENNYVEFLRYENKDNQINNRNCIRDLKLGKVELCIYVQTQQENGVLQSAQLVYIKDNTRSRIADILINMFERILKDKTEKISTNTVSEILSEVDSTLTIVNDSRIFVKEIHQSISNLQKEINNNDYEIRTTISTLENEIPELISAIDLVLINLEELETITSDDLSETSYLINENSKIVENTLESVYELQDILSSNKDVIGTEPLSYANSIETNLDFIKRSLNNFKTIIFNLETNLNSIEKNNIILNLKNLQKNIEEIEPVIQDLDSNYLFLKKALEDAKQQSGEISQKIDEKYDYFNTLSQGDSSQIVKPISTKTETLFKNFSRIHELSSGIIVVILLFIGLLLSNVIVSLEINSKAYVRNLISPVSQKKFIIALFFTSLIIILFQIFFFFIILQFVFSIPVFYYFNSTGIIIIQFWDALIIILHLLTVIILLGIVISMFINSIQISILVTTFIMLLLFLLSDIILPLELMPPFFNHLISYNPIVIAEELFRMLIFFPSLFSFSLLELLPFYIYTLVLIIFLIIATEYRKKQIL